MISAKDSLHFKILKCFVAHTVAPMKKLFSYKRSPRRGLPYQIPCWYVPRIFFQVKITTCVLCKLSYQLSISYHVVYAEDIRHKNGCSNLLFTCTCVHVVGELISSQILPISKLQKYYIAQIVGPTEKLFPHKNSVLRDL